MLEVHNVSKWFGGNPVLRDITFTIGKGEVIGLIGPNGAGKTTLFNVITGFFVTKTGYVKFNGKDITRFKPETICTLGLCRTFQITKPFGNIPVLKNVMIGALSRERSIKRAKKRAEEVFKKATDEFSIIPGIVLEALNWRHRKIRLTDSEMQDAFESTYTTVEQLALIVDKLEV